MTSRDDCMCNAGYFSTGSGTDSSCELCPDGTFKSSESNYLGCDSCSATNYTAALPDRTACACPTGHGPAYDQWPNCPLCEIGKYKSEIGNHSCDSCHDHSQTLTEGKTSADDCLCNWGYYSHFGACTACQEGTYKDHISNNYCRICPENTYTHLNVNTHCACNAGFGQYGMHNCSLCASGKYSDSLSIVSLHRPCMDCPDPLHTSSEGSSSIESCVCVPGSEGDMHSCVLCEPGTYNDQGATSVCMPCTNDTYSDTYGSLNCVPCPENSMASSGSDDVYDCTCNSGFFRISADLCLRECGQGQQRKIDVEVCEACPHGTWKSAFGTQACNDCPSNSGHELLGQVNHSACVCDVGFVGYPVCESCAVGKFNNLPGEEMCFDCYQVVNGICMPQNSGISHGCPGLCNSPAGYQIHLDGEHLEQCPAGTWNDGSRTSCQNCPTPNTASGPLAATSIQDCFCAPGYFRNTTSGLCDACERGSYKPNSGDTPCDTCAENSTTAQPGTVFAESCVCLVGYGWNGSRCVLCEGGQKFVLGNLPCITCPLHRTLQPGVEHNEAECSCNVGYTGSGTSACTACAQGKYKDTISDSPCTSCGAHTTSPAASENMSACECEEYYLADSQDGGPDTPGGKCVRQVRCAPGFVRRFGVSCDVCGPGTFSANENASYCESCVPPVDKTPAVATSALDCKCENGKVNINQNSYVTITSVGAMTGETDLFVSQYPYTTPELHVFEISVQTVRNFKVIASIAGIQTALLSCEPLCPSNVTILLPGRPCVIIFESSSTVSISKPSYLKYYTQREFTFEPSHSWTDSAFFSKLGSFILSKKIPVGDLVFNAAKEIYSPNSCETCPPAFRCKHH